MTRTLSPTLQEALNQELLALLTPERWGAAGGLQEFSTEITALLNRGADPDVKNEEGKSALELAHAMREGRDMRPIVRILTSFGADPNVKGSGGQPLIMEVGAGYVPMLASAGADLTVQDADGNTPLFRVGDDPWALLGMFSAGADVGHRNHAQQTVDQYVEEHVIATTPQVPLRGAIRNYAIALARNLQEWTAQVRDGTFDYARWLHSYSATTLNHPVGPTFTRLSEFCTVLDWLLNQPELEQRITKQTLLGNAEDAAHLQLAVSRNSTATAAVQNFCRRLGEPLTAADIEVAGWKDRFEGSPVVFFSHAYVLNTGWPEVKALYDALPDESQQKLLDFDHACTALVECAGQWLRESQQDCFAKEMRERIASIPEELRVLIPGMHQLRVNLRQQEQAESTQQGRG